MHVEEGVRQLGLQTLNHRMAEGEVGHKMAVHDVQVEVVRPRIQQPPAGTAYLLSPKVAAKSCARSV